MITDGFCCVGSTLRSRFLLLVFVGLAVGPASGQTRRDAVDPTVIEVKALTSAAHAQVTVTGHRCHLLPVKSVSGQPLPIVSPPGCERHPVQGRAGPISANCVNGCGILNYHGGPIITSTSHAFYFLNCIGGSGNCFSNNGDPYAFLRDLFESSFVHVTDQYIGSSASGRYTTNSAGYVWTQSGVAHTILDSDVQAFIMDLIRSQYPNGGGGGYNVMYTMFLPQGQDLCFNGSSACYCPDNNCGGGTFTFCAYHGSYDTTDAVGSAIHVVYQAMPYQNVSGCQTIGGPNGTLTDSTNSVLSHELIETITDPDGDAWWRTSDGNEIGDICNIFRQDPIYLNAGAYDIQPEYSNAAQNCIGSYPTVALTHDFNFDMNSDVLFRDGNTGTVAEWFMNGGSILSALSSGAVTGNWSIMGTGYFYGNGRFVNGKANILWRDAGSGTVAIWEMNGNQIVAAQAVSILPSNWSIVGVGDFNGDGKTDVLIQDSITGTVGVWLMNGNQILTAQTVNVLPSNWSIIGVGDFNGDGKADILLRDAISGTVGVWLMNGNQILSAQTIGALAGNWSVVGTGDFNGDGTTDILLRDSNSNVVAIWQIQGGALQSKFAVGVLAGNWQIVEIGDFNSDGRSDVLLRDINSNTVAIWEMNGGQILAAIAVGSVSSNWIIQSLNSD
jgi:hypothetical protein